MSFVLKNHWLLFVAFTVASLFLRPATTGGGSAGSDVRLSYGVVVDAGSSGTRVYVFRWPQDDPLGIEQVGWQRWRPGLSSLATEDTVGTPGALEAATVADLEKVLAHAVSVVPTDAHSSTPIMLMATAGLRLLPIEQAERILDGARTALSASPFVFDDGQKWATILPGQQEAVYMWTSAQVLKGSLGTDAQITTLDLGGGSTQIAAPLPASASSDVVANVDILTPSGEYTRTRLLAVSFLGLGQNEAFASYLKWYANTQEDEGGCPCLLLNQVEGDVAGLTAPDSQSFKRCRKSVVEFMDHLLSADGADVADVMSAVQQAVDGQTPPHIHGFDNYPKDILSVFSLSPPGTDEPAQPSTTLTDGTLTVTGRAAHALPAHGKAATRTRISRRHIRQRGTSVCPHVSLDDVTEQLAARNQASRNRKLCFGVAYIDALLTLYGVGLDDEVTLAQDLHGLEANWPLGAMCHRLGVIKLA